MILGRPFRSIPVTYRIPLLVALLMLVVSLVISERVLSRLADTQQQHMDTLAGTYLDGLAWSIMPAVLREDVWEVFDALDRSISSYGVFAPLETVVTDPTYRVLAATNPMTAPTYSILPESSGNRFTAQVVSIDPDHMVGYARRDLVHQGQHVGTIFATFDVAHIFAERREVLTTLIFTNAALAALLSLGGFLLVRRVLSPVLVLEDHMRSAAEGAAAPISISSSFARDPEVVSLFKGYNALVQAERERSNLALRLAEEERVASLGRLASGMAHEINNPLGGLMNALDTLKEHGASSSVRETSISLIQRGLRGIEDVVKATLATYRPDRTGRPLRVADVEDIRLLLRPEIERRKQALAWNVDWDDTVASSVVSVRQALLNLLLNACAATPDYGEVTLSMRIEEERLIARVSDEGRGLSGGAVAVLCAPEPNLALQSGHGLGLWMVRRVVDEAGGSIDVRQRQVGGSEVVLSLPLHAVGGSRRVA